MLAIGIGVPALFILATSAEDPIDWYGVGVMSIPFLLPASLKYAFSRTTTTLTPAAVEVKKLYDSYDQIRLNARMTAIGHFLDRPMIRYPAAGGKQ